MPLPVKLATAFVRTGSAQLDLVVVYVIFVKRPANAEAALQSGSADPVRPQCFRRVLCLEAREI